MKTKLIYLTDAYQTQASATVVEVNTEDKQSYVILDQTIFYAQGGGQPADKGIIKGPNGTLTVSHVSYNGGAVMHKGVLEGNLVSGQTVGLQLDWDQRYHHMQLHTAGHILDQAVKNIVSGAKSVDGNHGIGKRSYVEFTTAIPENLIQNIDQECERIIAADLAITTEMVTAQELQKRPDVQLPPDLPKNKDLRLLQIGEYPPMPDGGTHLKRTGESWAIRVTQIKVKEARYQVEYQVLPPSKSEQKHTAQKKPAKAEAANTQTKTSMSSLAGLKKSIAEVQSAFDAEPKDNMGELTTKYLGKKGLFNQLAKGLREIDPSVRKQAGQLLNELKSNLEQQLTLLGDSGTKTMQWVDLTAPGLKPSVGHMHPISQAMEEITHIFERIGFTRVRYPEVDWDWYAFESLNMPPDHPARDEWETFFVDVPDTTQDVLYDPTQPRRRHPSLVGGKVVLTPHTSNGQVREMERLNSQPPMRMINIARCYRRQQDATHTQMFHQFEGLVVDKGINIQHLKGTLDYFAREFYGPGTKSRIRPFHFQFTEPSFEVDFSCHICHGTGQVAEGVKCKFCKSGWHEVGGAGMVHPNVLRAGGIDPDEYTGFAFGWGIERTYTLKEGLNIDDIRLLYSGDLRFLEQF